MSDSSTRQIGARHGGDARGQPVVVAVADFGGRDRVVLVDDRRGAHVEQAFDGRARVEIAPALLGVPERDEDLPGRDAVRAEHLRPGARERDLADGGGGLAILELQRARRQAEHGAPERDRAGGDHENVGAAPVHGGEVGDQRVEPGALEAARRLVDEQRRADLDDDAAE